MLSKIKNIFSLSNNKCNIISNFSPLKLAENIIYSQKSDFTITDLKSELLDPIKSKQKVFSIYSDVFKSCDSLLFNSSNIQSSVFIISPQLIGREYSKTSSFQAVENKTPKQILFQVLNGEGYFLLESVYDEKTIVVIKVQKGNFVLVPKDYTFTIINSSETENLVCYSLSDKNTQLKQNILEKTNGATLFYTKQGFIRNENITPLYNLENFKGNFTDAFVFDKRKGLYDEFILTPEKFNFLKD